MRSFSRSAAVGVGPVDSRITPEGRAILLRLVEGDLVGTFKRPSML